MEGDEVAHLAADGRDADLESALCAAVAVPNANDDGAASTPDTSDAMLRAQVIDVEVEGLGLHRASVVRAVEVTGLAPVIALAAGLALLIGWYRGFNVRSLELTAAVFVVVLAAMPRSTYSAAYPSSRAARRRSSGRSALSRTRSISPTERR